VSYETVRRWVNHFGPKIAADLRKRRPKPHTIWHLDEVYLKIGGRLVYLRRAVDAEGKVLDVLVQTMLIGMLDMTQGAQLLSHFQPKGGSNGNRNKHPFRCRSNGAPGFVCKPCSGSGVWAEFADGLRGRILWRQRYLSFGCHDDYSGRKGSSGAILATIAAQEAAGNPEPPRG
jgi:hypothetical protein